jgi:putative DNA primase/helicase
MTDAATIAKALCGKPIFDGFMCSCPVSSHGKGRGDRNPSLLVKNGDRAPLFKCFGGCDTRDVIAELRRRGILDGRELAQTGANKRASPEKAPDHVPCPEAIEIWGKAARAAGSVVERYLQARGITLEPPPSLRVIGDRYFDRYDLVAMIAAVQAPNRSTIAVQATLLDPRGDRKAQVRVPRKTVGALGWGAVRLAAATDKLGLAEGIETALSAMQITGIPTWACLGACRMHRVWVPDTVQELHLFGDNDDPGRDAVERTAHAHRHRRVMVHFPPDHCPDWNDAVAFATAGSANADPSRRDVA